MYFKSSADLVSERADLPSSLIFTWGAANLVPIPRTFTLFRGTRFEDVYESKFWASRGVDEFILAVNGSDSPMLVKIYQDDPENIMPYLQDSPRLEQLFNMLISVSQERIRMNGGTESYRKDGNGALNLMDTQRRGWNAMLVATIEARGKFYMILEPQWAVRGFDEATPGIVYEVISDEFGPAGLSLCRDSKLVWEVLDKYVDFLENSGYFSDDEDLF